MASNSRRQLGISKFEIAIVTILVMILVTVATNRIALVRGRYEAIAMQGVLGGLRSALGIQMVARVVDPKLGSIASLAGSNPFLYLRELPKNYGGVIATENSTNLRLGFWYYDSSSGDIIYHVRATHWFESAGPEPGEVRFRVELQYDDINHDGVYTPGIDHLTGIDLSSLDDYSWET